MTFKLHRRGGEYVEQLRHSQKVTIRDVFAGVYLRRHREELKPVAEVVRMDKNLWELRRRSIPVVKRRNLRHLVFSDNWQ